MPIHRELFGPGSENSTVRLIPQLPKSDVVIDMGKAESKPPGPEWVRTYERTNDKIRDIRDKRMAGL